MSSSKPLFLYGTLRDEALFRSIVGACCDRVELSRSPGLALERRAVSPGGDYPVLVEAAGRELEGVLVRGLTEAAFDRLIAYEGPEYRLAPVRVRLQGADAAEEALAFAPVSEPSDMAQDWSYEEWLKDGAAVRREAGKELGRLYDLAEQRSGGRADPPQLAEITEAWPDLVGAAALRLGVPGPIGRALGPNFGREAVREDRRERMYDAYFKVDRLLLRHRNRRAGGAFSPELDRAVFRAGEAVGVLPYDPVTDRVALIEQFRPGPWITGDDRPWLVEIVAGRIEGASAGDPDEETARREALEEAGLTLGRLFRFDGGYASPGATDETLVYFAAEARLPAPLDGGAHGVDVIGDHGLAEEGEDIRVFSIGLDKAVEAVCAGEIRNIPAQLGVFWLARRRAQLREIWSTPGPLD